MSTAAGTCSELGAAAGAAACIRRRRLASGFLVHLERVAAAAARRRVRVVDREAALQAVDEVDLGALDLRRAERVDDDRDSEGVEPVVVLLGAGVEPEHVLVPG